MQAYAKSLASQGTTMVLNPDSEFFKYFGTQQAATPEAAARRTMMPALFTALGLVLVIEGLLYALVPGQLRRMAELLRQADG